MDVSREYIEMCKKARDELIELMPEYDQFGLIYASCLTVNMWNYSIDGSIWLPRQDQLQAMLKKTYKDFNYHFILERFRIKMWGRVSFSSMEQAWLACVMYEMHGKIWDEQKEEWIEEC